MSRHSLVRFAKCEDGFTSEWSMAAGLTLAFSLSAFAAVQTGILQIGTGSKGATLDTYGETIATGGTDVSMNDGKFVYKPLKTDKDKYNSLIFQMAGLSQTELSDIYVNYMDKAVAFLDAGDYQSAMDHLDIVGAAYEVMKDSRFKIPKTEYTLSDFYGRLDKKWGEEDISIKGDMTGSGAGKDYK
jgi:hypothetical protein